MTNGTITWGIRPMAGNVDRSQDRLAAAVDGVSAADHWSAWESHR